MCPGYPGAESAFLDLIHAANLDSGIVEGINFRFRKERLLIFVHLLQNCGDLNEVQTRSLRDAFLDKDEQRVLKLLKSFVKGKYGKWFSVFWNGREAVLTKEDKILRDANNDAMSTSDSNFLSYVMTVPPTSFLYDEAVECEKAAYTSLKTLLDSLVSEISRKVLLIQEKYASDQMKREVKLVKNEEKKVSREEFSRNIEGLSREQSKS